MIKFRCPHCGQRVVAPENYAGKRVRCRECRQPVKVPKPEMSSPPNHKTLLKVRCPHCNQKIGIDRSYAGQRIKCVKCHRPMRIPTIAKKIPQIKPRLTKVPSAAEISVHAVHGDRTPALSNAPGSASSQLQEPLRIKAPTPLQSNTLKISCPGCGIENSAKDVVCSGCGKLVGGSV